MSELLSRRRQLAALRSLQLRRRRLLLHQAPVQAFDAGELLVRAVSTLLLKRSRLGRHRRELAAEVAQQAALGLGKLFAGLALGVARPVREPLELVVLTQPQLLVDLLPARYDLGRQRLADLGEAREPAAQRLLVRLELAGDRLADPLFIRRAGAVGFQPANQLLVAVVLDVGEEAFL